MNRFDVAVIGGGPAGVAVALTLRRGGCSVVVLERSPYSAWRAGETLPPEIAAPLRALDLWERFVAEDNVVSGGICSAWGSSDLVERDFFFHPRGHGWHVDRLAFDRMLADAAQAAGVIVHGDGRVMSVATNPQGVVLRVADGGNVRDYQASALVDATGRGGALAVRLGARWVSYDRLVGVAGVFEAAAASENPEPILLVEAAKHGWWYAAALPGGRLVVTCLTDGDVVNGRRMPLESWWNDRLHETVHVKERVNSRSVIHPRMRRAHTGRLNRPVGDGWIAVGDAASAVDPLAGHGVLRALTGGIDGGRALLAHLAGDGAALRLYAERLVHAFDEDLRARADVYGGENRWPQSAFWRRRQLPVAAATVISLDPVTPVQEPATSRPDIEALLPMEDARLLEDLCRPPALAHEVAAAFRSRATIRPDDHSVVVALQVLLDKSIGSPT